MSEAIPGSAPKTVTVIGTVNASGNAQASSVATPVPTDSGAATRTPKGYEQITGITSTTVKHLTGATGAKFAIVTPKVDGRWRDDGTDPTATVGIPISAGQPYKFDETDLTAVRFILVDTLDVSYYA